MIYNCSASPYTYHADRKKPVLPPLKYLIGDTGIYPGGTYAANRNP